MILRVNRISSSIRIPVNDLSRHNAPLRERLSRALECVLESGWYILGPRVAEFESRFATYCGVDQCVGTGNGTDALEIALRACGVGPGQRVITVANAGGYSTGAILATGATPAFIDIEPSTHLLSLDQLHGALSERVGAIVVTHLYGQMAPMHDVMNMADAVGVPVIEDCAQAHGAQLDGRPAGAWGACGCFSFYPTKNLGALGDGGAIVTHDSGLAERVRALRNYGWIEKYRVDVGGGSNSRLDGIQAAVLLEKLPLIDGWNERRRAIARRYSEALADRGIVTCRGAGLDDAVHLFVVRIPNRDTVRQRLAEAGVGADVHYPVPDHLQHAWSSERWARTNLPHTEASCREVLTLPCFPELIDEEIAEVITAFLQVTRC
jgi:dTDP-4-amino-4,6-dideoxygalactose transaminase